MAAEVVHRHRAGGFLVFYLLLGFLCLALRVDAYVSGIKSTLWFLISPNVVYSGQFFDKLDSLRGTLFHLVRVEGENVILREQMSELSKREVEREALEQENARLRTLLDLRQRQFSDSVAAEVVGRDLRDWFHAVSINKGEKDGVVLSAAVVQAKGERPTLIGRVTELSGHSSKVLLITDIVSAISVGFVGKDDVGLLEGDNRPWVKIRYLSQQSQVSPGDEVITMGLGGVFPPGIPVGKVTKVSGSPDGFFREAHVVPYTDFGTLHEVLVLQRKESAPLELMKEIVPKEPVKK